MSEFEKWFRNLNANGKTVYFLGNEHKVSEMAWNHQQAIIDGLKAQLNNMEAVAKNDLEAMKDPNNVHNLMIRGVIGTPALMQCLHLHGSEAIERWNRIDQLKSQLNNMEACYIGVKKELEKLQGQLKTWKGQSLAAMLHGTCKCGEPWQSIVSDREGFNLLHCFNCNNDRYENKEFFGDHEPKSMRGEHEQ